MIVTNARDALRFCRGLPLILSITFTSSYNHAQFQCRLGLVKVMLDPQEGPVLEDSDPQLRKGLLDSIQTYQEEEQRRPAFRSGQTPARYRWATNFVMSGRILTLFQAWFTKIKRGQKIHLSIHHRRYVTLRTPSRVTQDFYFVEVAD